MLLCFVPFLICPRPFLTIGYWLFREAKVTLRKPQQTPVNIVSVTLGNIFHPLRRGNPGGPRRLDSSSSSSSDFIELSRLSQVARPSSGVCRGGAAARATNSGMGRAGTPWDGLWDGLNIEITQCLCGLGRRDGLKGGCGCPLLLIVQSSS